MRPRIEEYQRLGDFFAAVDGYAAYFDSPVVRYLVGRAVAEMRERLPYLPWAAFDAAMEARDPAAAKIALDDLAALLVSQELPAPVAYSAPELILSRGAAPRGAAARGEA